MARAALVVGSHGLMIEMHPEPEKALCDGAQSLTPDGFSQLMKQLQQLQACLGGLDPD
jgi:3-deoxy-7-phosphoheptulonate synthase